MSNLKMPPCDYKSLDTLLPTTLGKSETELCYKTSARRSAVSETIIVKHHYTDIAAVDRWDVSVMTDGWVSATTTNRVHKILRDNHIPWFFSMSHGQNWLTDEHDRIIQNVTSAHFVMKAGVWELDGLNADAQEIS